MKKLSILITLLVFCFGFSQSTDYADRMEHIFGNINKTKVTTGYLKEFGIRFNEVEVYNGVISNNNFVDKTQWQSLYSSLYTMRVGTVAQNMVAPATVFGNLKTQQAGTSDILLAVQHYTYQQYKANAYTNGDVTINNDRIYDVAGRNPYETKRIFAGTPLKSVLQGNTFTFKLPSTMVYGNTGLIPTQIQVDFGNGQGYQTVSYDTPISVTYALGGEKEIKIKFVYGSMKGATYYSHSKIYVDYTPPSSNHMARFDGSGATTHIITGNPWQGTSAIGIVTVELAPGHTQLTKPLIVVEGFDPDNSFNYNSFINGIGPGGINIPLGGGTTLNQAIEDEGYDLVFINYVNGTDYIQRNAYMVKTVIDWVNNQKTGNEKNVVLGMSMGGLVARYALRDMELNNETHDTKLYISHDAPHQGANIPLSAQAMVRHLVGEQIHLPVFMGLFDFTLEEMSVIVPDLIDGLNMLQTPAARQMLIYQLQGTGAGISVNNSSLYHSFATEYKNMGYPQQGGIRNIAIANGAECGTPLDFNPYANIIDINMKVDLPFFITNVGLAIVNGLTVNPVGVITSILSTNTDIKAEFNLKALPNQQSKQIYKGKIYIKKKILWIIDVEEQLIDNKTLNSTASMLPLDNAGGGIYNIEMFAELPQELNNYVLERQFNFIPTFSSLDISGGNQTMLYSDLTKAYSPLSPPLSPKNTPFHNFYTNPTTSENHIQFTLNNGNWLLDELQGNTAFYSCASSCSEELNLNIAGLSHLCSSTAYTLENLISGKQVVWSISPSNAATITTGNGSTTVSITRNINYNGAFTLSASVDTNCGNVIVQKNIWAGIPQVSYPVGCFQPQIGENCFEMCRSIHFSMENAVTVVPQGLDLLTNQFDWEWEQVSGNFAWTTNGDTAYLQPYQVGNIVFRVRAKNQCGWSNWLYYQISVVNCGSGPGGFSMMSSEQKFYSVYPNPSNDIVYIDLLDSENQPLQESEITGKLYDLMGNLKSTVQVINNQATFSVQGLNTGVYLLKIYIDEQETEAHNIAVQ